MGSCGVGGESGVGEQETESDPGSPPHCPVFTSLAWLGLIPAFANYLGVSLPPLDLLPFLFPKGKGSLCSFGGGPFPSGLYTPPDSLTRSPILPLTVALPSSGTMG